MLVGRREGCKVPAYPTSAAAANALPLWATVVRRSLTKLTHPFGHSREGASRYDICIGGEGGGHGKADVVMEVA